MYDLNEFNALELLCTAQQQVHNHPGLPRGLVAVLLYYDGRKTLVSALKELMQARLGISWCTDTSPEITQLVTNYTDSLVKDGLLDKIIELIKTLDISREIELLTNPNYRALGPPKHHSQVTALYEDARLLLANVLFNYSAQCGLPKEIVVKLINFLAKHKPASASGAIDDFTLALQMALLYATDLSILHRHEEGDEIARDLPIIRDVDFIDNVMQTLLTPWESEGFHSLTLFSLGLAIATIRLAPAAIYSGAARIIDQDEILVDKAINCRVFDFIQHLLLDNEQIYKNEFYYRRIHFIFTDFIELMHSKVTELRARADETARMVQGYQQQGITPPTNLCRSFESLLLAIGKLYAKDSLGLKLSLEYWGPADTTPSYHRSLTRSVCLFKFIRLAGDLLPQMLFVPYLKMLAGLSSNPESARNAFNLLKQGSGTTGSATISWDHFFNSFAKYYASLRQEQHPGTETIYHSRALSRLISPQEIAGLQAVLEVVQAVADHDDVARTALCEHPGWAPLHTLLGLVGCSVVIPLKADLLRALAALAKSKETALHLWNNLEASQIIVTVPTTAAFTNRGIESELEEIEARNETYPLTIATLELLYNLSAAVIPKNLGSGTRKPGLNPYVTFVIDTIFLRFYSRNYKDRAEKWLVASKVLTLLEMFLKVYEINPADFPNANQVKQENPPPGFHVMLQLNTKSDFLRLVLLLLDDACALFESYSPISGRQHLEEMTNLCLSLLEQALRHQETFFNAHFTANCSTPLYGLNKLLLGVNPRSGKPDHLLNVAKLVTFNAALPRQALTSIKILTHIIKLPTVNQHLLSLFLQSEKTRLEIRHGFVECLENDSTVDTDEDETVVNLKEAVIDLLQESLPHSAPNLAHYLFGFNVTGKDIRVTNMQQPGVLDYPSTCTKSIINLLDNALENSQKQITASPEQQRLISKAYNLFFNLCFDPRSSEVILRFLRSCNDFLSRHIAGLPYHDTNNPDVLNQMSSLLKCVAIELKQTAKSNQVTQFRNLCNILLGSVESTNTVDKTSLEISHYHSSIVANNSIIMEVPSTRRKTTDTTLLLCQLLECVDLHLHQVDKPRWEYFDTAMLQTLIKSCEITKPNQLKLIDLKKLHDVLREEINSVQSTVIVCYLNQIMQEMEQVLEYGLALNNQRHATNATVRFLEAWGQVTEILFCVAPVFVLTNDVKQTLILEIMQALLNKVATIDMTQELAATTSATVLMLFVNLRHCYQGKISKLNL